MSKISIYTDGGARPTNPGPGAWAYCGLEDETSILAASGYVEHTTNNKMELQAVIEALTELLNVKPVDKLPMVTVYSDSSYVVKGMNEWIFGWRAKQFKRVKNEGLWKELDAIASKYHQLKFVHVRAHSGNTYNEIVDTMCTNTILDNQ